MSPILARCGYRCDLCPAYRENIRTPEEQQATSDGWFRLFGFRIPPEQIPCDGCRDDRMLARRIDAGCPIRHCAMRRGVETCAECPELGCAQFASRAVTRAGVEQRIGTRLSEEDYHRFVLPYERTGFANGGGKQAG